MQSPEFESFVDDSKSLQMARFLYKQQRLKLDILLTPDCQPQGGQWSFDAENRKKLPKDVQPPALPQAFENKHLAEVISSVAEVFADHPGQAKDFAADHKGWCLAWLDDFLQQRLAQFGPFEDAISQRLDTLFTALSPLMNIGLLTPKEAVAAALERAKTDDKALLPVWRVLCGKLLDGGNLFVGFIRIFQSVSSRLILAA